MTIERETRPLIVHVVYRFDIGGLENGVVNLINRLPESSWRHAIVALTEVSAAFKQRVQRHDVQYLSLHKPPGQLWRLYPQLTRMFRQLRPSIVHTRNLGALEAVVPAWAAGVKARIHGEHGRDATDPDGTRRRYQWMRRAYRPFVSRYVAVSKDLERYLHERVGIARESVVQLYNGVDLRRFQPPTAARWTIDGCPFRSPQRWLLGTVGRLDPVKDQTTLARAFVLLTQMKRPAFDQLRLVIVGDGILRAEVDRILQDGGARDRAWFAGDRDDVDHVLRGLDCFVLPSRAEGVSNTILEAMACAVPVIATRVGGNVELIDPSVTGTLIPSGDPRALAQAIAEYFENPELARRHADAGRARVEQAFSLDNMVAGYHQLYQTELGRSSRAAAAPVSSLPSAES